MGVPDEVFEEKITQTRAKTGAKTDAELNGDNWKTLTQEFKAIYRQHTHHPNLTNLKIRLQHVDTLEKVDTLLTQIAEKETDKTRGQMFRQRFKVSPIDTEVNHIASDCQTYGGQQRVG